MIWPGELWTATTLLLSGPVMFLFYLISEVSVYLSDPCPTLAGLHFHTSRLASVSALLLHLLLDQKWNETGHSLIHSFILS